ncbi:M20/M25/M40 family metallo-hydrolase [Ruminiclostridium cellobioparum]|uniref:Peptidase T-like protein n=1 Tax=Ruminiclostridium cellobioparum subsp. termitidis CT1112 TaxID=1195236 RepID=S0FFB1_RUMCE|nr:M20/M25/M40 family metallo-hydrolase [Ruminiclostridium cellobioparum]EMS69485.1 peptidase T-like protein [Ruminiclostridium cellobioparum subsp. termitidis CT1112]
MVNRNRMVDEFVELVRIDSLSLKERQMCDTLKRKLTGLGYQPAEDDAGKKLGGQCGNIICTVKGSRDVPAVLITAHMDTVVPGIGKTPVIEGDIIKSDGTTILGGDDAAGIAVILETLKVIKEQGVSHGDIQIAFTIGEEMGLLGAKNLDYSRIYAKYGFILDSDGRIGCAAVKAPSQNKIHAVIKGKAAHAGMEPENGVSAFSIMADAISSMKLGRIDEETTANIGTVHGGVATNIVCDRVEIEGEARSRDESKLQAQTEHMRECFVKAAEKWGGKVEFISEIEYPAFNISRESEIVKILESAAADSGFAFEAVTTGGGSDTNIINSKGIQAVDLSVGMTKVHSVDEQISITDMENAVLFLISILKNIR